MSIFLDFTINLSGWILVWEWSSLYVRRRAWHRKCVECPVQTAMPCLLFIRWTKESAINYGRQRPAVEAADWIMYFSEDFVWVTPAYIQKKGSLSLFFRITFLPLFQMTGKGTSGLPCRKEQNTLICTLSKQNYLNCEETFPHHD